MLEKEDKEWIVDLITGLLDRQTMELCQTMTRGFAQCVSVDRFEARMGGVEGRLDGVEGRLTTVEAHLGSLEQRIIHIEDTMVTRDYLDKRLFDFKERRVNEPIKQLKTIDLNILEELKAKKIVNPKRANSIASMHPFPQKLASA